jgi:hypothetical protein
VEHGERGREPQRHEQRQQQREHDEDGEEEREPHARHRLGVADADIAAKKRPHAGSGHESCDERDRYW